MNAVDTGLRELIASLIRDELPAAVETAFAKRARESQPAASDDVYMDGALARLIGISVETIQQWRTRDEGPPFIKMDRALRAVPRCQRPRLDGRARARSEASDLVHTAVYYPTSTRNSIAITAPITATRIPPSHVGV